MKTTQTKNVVQKNSAGDESLNYLPLDRCV